MWAGRGPAVTPGAEVRPWLPRSVKASLVKAAGWRDSVGFRPQVIYRRFPVLVTRRWSPDPEPASATLGLSLGRPAGLGQLPHLL